MIYILNKKDTQRTRLGTRVQNQLNLCGGFNDHFSTDDERTWDETNTEFLARGENFSVTSAIA